MGAKIGDNRPNGTERKTACKAARQGKRRPQCRSLSLTSGIKCVIIPRKKEKSGVDISASNVRLLLKEGNLEGIKELVPESTYKFFMSDEGKKIIKKIEQIEDVIHY